LERVVFWRPASIQTALEILRDVEGTCVIAGGTDLVVSARRARRQLPSSLLSVQHVTEMRGVSMRNGHITVGAGTTHAEAAASQMVRQHIPALVDACRLIGSPATRATGTIGGNVMNASPAMETGPVLLAHGAVGVLSSVGECRRVDLGELVTAPGETSRRSSELLSDIDIPVPKERTGSAYMRLEYRNAMELAVVGVAGVVKVSADGINADCTLALGAVAPKMILVRSAGPIDEVFGEVIANAIPKARPISDLRGSLEYRLAMIPVIARRTLDTAFRRALEPASQRAEGWAQ
jgi:CO/xanthine dehydrogenase FAD-binding subunit